MWLTAGHNEQDFPAGLDTVHNYYERLVLDEIARNCERANEDRDFFADVACVALNRLPPRYIRYDVDMTFFLSQVELQEIYDKVELAVSTAIDYVSSREARPEEAETDSQTISKQPESNPNPPKPEH